MKIFALADLHLSLTGSVDFNDATTLHGTKPMGIFGANWQGHTEKIYENWQSMVGESDLVLLPGDISWAMTLEAAKWDLEFIGRLKGRKIMLRGNHDYWWHSPKKIKEVLPPGIELLQNNAITLGDFAITGTRLWSLPGTAEFQESDLKIYKRELIRLELSLEAAKNMPLLTMFHYMPTNEAKESNEVIELLQSYSVEKVIYGHLHDKSHRIAIEGRHWGMDFHLVSCDYIDFKPKFIQEI